jgi:hypothetical protein
MIFDRNVTYTLRNTNNYGLTRRNHTEITNNDFTFLAKCSPNFNVEIGTENFYRGYVLSKNGMHIGIYFTKSGTELNFSYEIGCSYCVTDGTNVSFRNIDISVDSSTSTFDVSMRHNIKNKTMTLKVNNVEKTDTYNDSLVDYTNSWMWIGSGYGILNGVNHHAYYYDGEIEYIAVFEKDINLIDSDTILSEKKNINFDSPLKPLVIIDFNEHTKYKIKDISNNGNHFELYNVNWV